MADSSNTPLDARIEAAAKAAYEWDADKLTCPPWDEYDEGARGWYREIVTVVLAAADAVENKRSEADRKSFNEYVTSMEQRCNEVHNEDAAENERLRGLLHSVQRRARDELGIEF